MISYLKKQKNRWAVLQGQPVFLGLLIIVFLCFFYSHSLWQLWHYPDKTALSDHINDAYFRHILIFSFFQALLSALLSVSLGLLLAHALFYEEFPGKNWVIKLFSLTMVLPALVAIFGLMGIYGNSGWLAQLCQLLGCDWRPNIYGLTGILIAHVFFNLPLAGRLFLQALQAIPPEQHQLAAQLNLTGQRFYQLIEWPYLRQQFLPVFTLIFMLCFTSFTIVLTLGGGPKYTTLEVAIYQAIIFDFELDKAAFLALVQFVICLTLFQISHYLTSAVATHQHHKPRWLISRSVRLRCLHRLILVMAIGFIFLPLLQVILSGFSWSLWSAALTDRQLWRALGYSAFMAPAAGLLAVLMSSGLLLGARQFHWHGFNRLANQLMQFGLLVLAVPTLVLSVGLFLWLRHLQVSTPLLLVIVIFCNALMAMPFVVRLLTTPFLQNMAYYEALCQSLNLRGWQRFRLIEWHTLKQPIRGAFALASALSLGDFTAIALFGNQHFTSLPRLLYQQLGHYRSQEAAVTAVILLLFCFFIFLMIETDPHDKTSATAV